MLLQTINEIDDAEKRMKAIHVLLEKVEKEKEKEKEIDVLKVEVEKEKVEKEKDVLKVEKEKAVFQERLIKLEEDLLQAKGLMTARGVFERVVQLAFNEQKTVGKVKGKCIIANILPTIVIIHRQDAFRNYTSVLQKDATAPRASKMHCKVFGLNSHSKFTTFRGAEMSR